VRAIIASHAAAHSADNLGWLSLSGLCCAFRDRWRGFGAKGSGRLLTARPNAWAARAGPLARCACGAMDGPPCSLATSHWKIYSTRAA
jgi:hypothetical protein